MDIRNPFNLLRDLTRKPATIPSQVLDMKPLSTEEKDLIRRVGLTSSQLRRDLQADTQVQWDRQRFYHEVNRSLEHWLIGCLRGDVKIRLCDGTSVSIAEMANDPDRYVGKYTWSVNPATLNMEPDKITAVARTRRNAQLVKVHLDNGKVITCTPDHKFMLRNGLYQEAQYLSSGTSLMPFYSESSRKGLIGYECIYNPKTDRWQHAHRLVVEERWVNYPKRRGYVVHHKNYRRENNDPTNLEIMTRSAHTSLHSLLGGNENHDKETCQCPYCKIARGEFPRTPEGEARRINAVKDKKTLPREIRACIEPGCGNTFEAIITSKQKYCQPNHPVLREERICAYSECDTIFEEIITDPKKYCCRRCCCLATNGQEESREKASESVKKHWATTDRSKRIQKLQEVHKFQKGIPIHLRVEAREAEEAMLNHKVIKVEWITDREDTYDITTEKNHNFSLASGVIVHNSAVRLYADYATVMSPIHNASVWITSENTKYYKILSKLLDDIGIEEKIFDWAWTTAAFGDLFVEIDGRPSLGIVSINDDRHPLQVNRVDHNGILIGYTESRLGSSHEHKLLPPWKFVHLRLLGAKRKRPVFSDPLYSEFRTMNLMSGTDTRMVSSKYGASLLLDAMPTYKRLKLAEDSLLLARMTRGITRYIWKLAVNHTNMEAVQELIDQIATTLKRARSLNTSDASPYYDSKENPMGVTEDIFMPVWGDNTNALTFDEIGGKPDIRWIVDIDGLRNQLACTLRTPLQLLGGYVDEATGALGSESIEKLDIGFARNARRLQRAMRQGIKRICQIHLAYQNMDPDPALFEVQMSETSTAEEEVIKGTFETGIDIIDRVIDIMEKIDPNIDKEKVFDYMNMKILKLEGFNLSKFKKVVLAEGIKEVEPEKVAETFKRYPIGNTDLVSYLPLVMKEISEGGKTRNVGPNLSERSTVLFAERWGKNWEYQYSKVKAIETKGGRVPHNSEANQMTFKQLREKKEAEDKAREDELLLVEV